MRFDQYQLRGINIVRFRRTPLLGAAGRRRCAASSIHHPMKDTAAAHAFLRRCFGGKLMIDPINDAASSPASRHSQTARELAPSVYLAARHMTSSYGHGRGHSPQRSASRRYAPLRCRTTYRWQRRLAAEGISGGRPISRHPASDLFRRSVRRSSRSPTARRRVGAPAGPRDRPEHRSTTSRRGRAGRPARADRSSRTTASTRSP